MSRKDKKLAGVTGRTEDPRHAHAPGLPRELQKLIARAQRKW